MTNRIEQPFQLLGLPRPIGGNKSSTQASSIWQYSSHNIRSRPEVVVAVDGEGVYLYDIDNPRLITSYAVSPETKFLCPPVSLLRRRVDRRLERITYAAVHLRDSQISKVLCWRQERRKQAVNVSTQSPWDHLSTEIADVNAQVHSLQILPGELLSLKLSDAVGVCVVHEQHGIELFTGDLTQRKASYKRQVSEARRSSTEFVAILPLSKLKQGLLRHRQDIATTLEQSGIDEDQPNLLMLVRADRHKKKDKKISRNIFLTRLTGATSVDDPGNFLKKHGLIKVQRLGGARSKEDVKYHLSRDASQLSAQVDGALLLWKLSAWDLIPDVIAKSDIISHLNLGQSEFLTVSAEKCQLFNAEWQAVRAEVFPGTETQAGEKSSRDNILTSFADLSLLQFFEATNLTVALSASALIGIPISRTNLKKRGRDIMTLADAVGRARTDIPAELGGLTEFAKKARLFADEQSSSDLEILVAEQLQLIREERVDGADLGPDVFANNGTAAWVMPKDKSTVIQNTSSDMARLVLSECIRYNPLDSSCPFYVQLFSHSIFKWLASCGWLTSHALQLAHGQSVSTTSSLMIALANYDSAFAVMQTVLGWSHVIDIHELVTALGFAIDSLEIPSNVNGQMATITDGHESADDRSVADATQAAEDDLAYALASLNDGAAIRSGLLRAIFDRLFTFSHEDIVKSFRASLGPQEIVFLINLLRIELADGGWTTRYTDEPYDESLADDGPADNSISIIVKLLNAAIDTIGPVGWNVGLSSDRQLNTDDMLVVLRAEINAAYDGCQEYQCIADVLQEFTKYFKTAPPLRKKRKIDPIRNPGFLKEEPMDALLPLGAKHDRLETTRVAEGGEIASKSKPRLGQEISMRVGKFSIDRIRV